MAGRYLPNAFTVDRLRSDGFGSFFTGEFITHLLLLQSRAILSVSYFVYHARDNNFLFIISLFLLRCQETFSTAGTWNPTASLKDSLQRLVPSSCLCHMKKSCRGTSQNEKIFRGVTCTISIICNPQRKSCLLSYV